MGARLAGRSCRVERPVTDRPPTGSEEEVAGQDIRLTETQRKILEALCRPCIGENHYAPPATNQDIADQLFLSVDAIKAHLRVLYRKFGIEPLPHNQKRARLVELAMDGGIVSGQTAIDGPPSQPSVEAGDRAVVASAEGPEGAAADSASPAPRSMPRHQQAGRLIAAGAALGVIVLAVVLAVILGGSDGEGEPAPTKTQYVATLQRFCRFALRSGGDRGEATRQRRAVDYLKSIELVRGPINSETPPPGDDPRLEQFRTGVNSAADLNGQVASAPEGAAPGSLAKASANLILAAGQVQAGALGYKLGAPCASLGDLIERSAQNAAGPP